LGLRNSTEAPCATLVVVVMVEAVVEAVDVGVEVAVDRLEVVEVASDVGEVADVCEPPPPPQPAVPSAMSKSTIADASVFSVGCMVKVLRAGTPKRGMNEPRERYRDQPPPGPAH